jgi:hypothetical protein
MTPALRLIPPVEEAPPQAAVAPGRDWPLEVWAAFGAAVVVGVLALGWPDSTAQALLRKEPAERAALFQRTRASVADLCAGEPGLRDACRRDCDIRPVACAQLHAPYEHGGACADRPAGWHEVPIDHHTH